ncbi:MAG: hypothetical protein ACKVT2_21900 [Saprospiraceae bacterium]
MIIRFSLLEIFLVETIAWLSLWLLDEYIAGLLTIIIGAIVSAVLIIALISEAIERSNVPKKYFQVMAISILSIFVAAAIGWPYNNL